MDRSGAGWLLSRVATGFVIGVIFTVGGESIAEAVAYSSWNRLGTSQGVTYDGRTYVDTTSTPGGGGQLRGTNTNIPAGWGGVRPRLYRNDAICLDKGVSYNSVAVYIVSSSATKDCGSGAYNSLARFDTWNGSSYEQYVFYSPYQNK